MHPGSVRQPGVDRRGIGVDPTADRMDHPVDDPQDVAHGHPPRFRAHEAALDGDAGRPQLLQASPSDARVRILGGTDETGDAANSILAGRALRSNKSITLNKDVLKRHAAVLGGSGSGKTTLALCVIEQLLLKGTPAVLIETRRDKYACMKHEEAGVLTPPVPIHPIEKGMATAGLLSHVLVAKCKDHLPLYRQSCIFARYGAELAESTLCDWVKGAAEMLTQQGGKPKPRNQS